MMRSKIIACSVTLCMFSSVIAQNREVTGRVTDPRSGSPLSGVTVQAKGSSTVTLTTTDGNFRISVPANTNTLVFSYVGYSDQEVAITGAPLLVSLVPGNNQLTEVVVTGYNRRSKRDFAGSAGVVKGEDIQNIPFASFDQMLQGQTPGLILRAQGGQPGNSGTTIIRGRGSLQGSVEPIYIVDGIQIAAADFSLLNPNDIENVSILKDAVAASLYGSRGANGVIVVTTKRGKAGKTNFDVDLYTGWSTFPDFKGFKLMNSSEKIDYELRRGGTLLSTYSAAQIDSLRKIDTDWRDVLTRTGRTYNMNAAASGGGEKTRYFASVNYFKQEGTLINTGFDRITGRLNISQDAGNFSFGLNTTGSYANYMNSNENDQVISSPLNGIQWTNPYEQEFIPGSYNALGNLVRGGSTLTRPRVTLTGQPIPTTELYLNTNQTKQIRLVAAGNAEYRVPFVKGLSLRTVYGIDYRQAEGTAFVDRTTYTGGSNPRPTSGPNANYRTNSFARDYGRSQRITNTNSINYSNAFGDHTVDAGLYHEYIEQRNQNNGNTTFSLNNKLPNEAGSTITADLLPRIRVGGGEARIQSYFATANYGYKNRYFLNASIRRDGSSRFGRDKRNATFGGAGISWIVSDEAFMSSLKGNFLNNLKFKASYGTVGSQEGIGFYESQGTVAARLYNAVAGTNVTLLESADLQWESRKKFNTGLEFSLLRSKITGGIEYYNELTDNLFFPTELSRTTGFANLTRNVGSVRNSGVEFNMNANLINNKDLKLSLIGNITFNKNQIVELAGKDSVVTGTFGFNVRIKGQPINRFFLVEYAGVDPQTGYAQYRKLDGSLTTEYDDADRRAIGNADPNIFGGFGLNAEWKGFTLNTQFTYMLGTKVYNNERNNLENPDYFVDNVSNWLLREWQKPGDITDIPNPNTGPNGENPFVSSTTRFLEDNSFLRLRNITLSYSLPRSVVSKLKMRGLSVYVSGTNLWTATKYTGRDPEFPNTALIGAQYPALRTIQTGLRLNF